ncbi:hypothetical protein PHYBOEH_011550 [Phytophthora boehmeriae]|uniref:Uncharacterized protein n=1 Tax=Phytophthora boehmeriae TaxID=109152 RepID=A0A8T1WY33_9STRA|nr:hypothetical protein PHYBOEH_011550 [Phytophthora boehmeriae]
MQSNGLDASYALLSDVSARNRALQARLQSSLPLLWRDNALVLTNAAPRRRRATGISSSIAFQSQDSGEVDSMLMALEETTQASRRYRRRVEWEVARRIARVDRELQQYSPEQRFWNKQKIVKTPPFTKYRQRGHTVGRTNAKNRARSRTGL